MEFSNLDSPSMHFAVGMLCTGVLCVPMGLLRPQWWPLMPLLQSLGGVFALVPDFWLIPSFYPSILGGIDAQELKSILDGDIGNIFFFHAAMDATGEGSFLGGFVLVALQYNLWILVFITHYYHSRIQPSLHHRYLDVPTTPVPQKGSVASPFDTGPLRIDEARQVFILRDGDDSKHKTEIPFGTLLACEVIVNGHSVARISKENSIPCFGDEMKANLATALRGIEKQSMGPNSKREINLRFSCDQTGNHNVNLYHREGNYRYSAYPYTETVEHVLRICAFISSEFDKNRNLD